ncbi:hypothetical protein CALVIDRAFT_134528 [Calocera viscosa TUFC12733]|uniref:Uncharacterized protein n=1 Tax=Calocera viscosa (strain TUFC12733) TaxID=1330018 RepID=A0A167LXB0_CALVF|nr:hypothetical protein CALVIDRAFT_134528 [Calocera viscosa TUFC12733]
MQQSGDRSSRPTRPTLPRAMQSWPGRLPPVPTMNSHTAHTPPRIEPIPSSSSLGQPNHSGPWPGTPRTAQQRIDAANYAPEPELRHRVHK